MAVLSHLSIIHCFFIMYLWYRYVSWITFDVILRLSVQEIISHLYLDFGKLVSGHFHVIAEMAFPGFSLETGYHFLTQNKGDTKHFCPELATELRIVGWVAELQLHRLSGLTWGVSLFPTFLCPLSKRVAITTLELLIKERNFSFKLSCTNFMINTVQNNGTFLNWNLQ